MSALFTKSVDESRLPGEWKTGEVIPIYKKVTIEARPAIAQSASPPSHLKSSSPSPEIISSNISPHQDCYVTPNTAAT